jgi:putative DNA primase/helicase
MSNNYTLKGLNISGSEFINVFYSPDDTKICLRVLADKKGSAFSGTNINTTLKELPNIIALLEQHNSDNRGIFLLINAGGHTDKEIIRINAQFVEMDNVSLELSLVVDNNLGERLPRDVSQRLSHAVRADMVWL